MGVNITTVRTVSCEWILSGAKPTVADFLRIARELMDADIPESEIVQFEPPYSDMQSYPARIFIKPFEVID